MRSKPKIYFDRETNQWVVDGGQLPVEFRRWGSALRWAARYWYGARGDRWWVTFRWPS